MPKSDAAMRVVFFILVLFIVPTVFGAESIDTPNSEITTRLSGISAQLREFQQQHVDDSRALKAQAAIIEKIQSDQLILTQQLLTAQQNERDARRLLHGLEADANRASSRGIIATVLNVLGMILGIAGGISMAGAQLSARQERIPTLRATRRLVDLATRDTQQEPVLNFFGLIGSIAIALGFVLQFAGALVTSSLSPFTLIIAALLAAIFVFFLVLFFLGHTSDQTRMEKIAVISHNMRRHIAQPIWRLLTRQRSIACQVCLRKLKPNDVEIWWLQEEASKTHPYLYEPYDYNYGHKACLPKSDDFSSYFERRGKDQRLTLCQVSGADFINKTVPKFREWYLGFHKHWTEQRGTSSHETAFEEQLHRVDQDIAMLMGTRNEATAQTASAGQDAKRQVE